MGEQNLLLRDMQTAMAYCDQWPDESSGIRFDRGNPAKLIAYFTARLDEHESELKAQLEHPDRLVVVESLASRNQQEAVITSIREKAGPEGFGTELTGMGRRAEGTVSIMMRPGQDALAESLRREYGDMVEIRFGIAQVFPGPAE